MQKQAKLALMLLVTCAGCVGPDDTSIGYDEDPVLPTIVADTTKVPAIPADSTPEPLHVVTLPAVLASTAVVVPGDAFSRRQGNPTRTDTVWSMPSSQTSEVVCGISLPTGARITGLLWSVKPQSSFTVYDFKLVRRALGGGTPAEFLTASAFVDNYDYGWQLKDSAAHGSYVIESGFSYQLSITGTAAGAYAPPALFDGVEIIYE